MAALLDRVRGVNIKGVTRWKRSGTWLVWMVNNLLTECDVEKLVVETHNAIHLIKF